MRKKKGEKMEFINDIFGSYVVVVVLGICLCAGYIIKHLVSTDKINRYIPLIMGSLGVVLNVWINMTFSPEVILGGLVSGLASTGAHQVLKQILKKE